jgi:RNA polymerase sigma factor (sigma-70 family)
MHIVAGSQTEIKDSPPERWTVAELLERCSRRPADEVAWEEFVRRFHSIIRSSVIRAFNQKVRKKAEHKQQPSNDLINDLVQLVYLKCIENRSEALRRFRGRHEKSIFQYLTIISINVVRDYFRAINAQKRPRVTLSMEELSETGIPVRHEELTMEEIESALRKAVGWKHPSRDMLLFKLRYIEGLTLEEIIKVTNLNVSVVALNSTLKRIVMRMKRLLAR